MGIKEVRKEIVDSAKAQANKIILEAEDEKFSLNKAIDERIKTEKVRLENNAENYLVQFKTRTTAESESQINRMKLASERLILNEVFLAAKEKLSKLDGKQRLNHIHEILGSVNMKYKTVYCAKKDTKLIKKSKPMDITGGVVLENDRGDVRLDISYDTLLQEIINEKLSSVYKILFD